ncbi:3-hydroxyacyl-CoA dehydrogenase NAD-binding domain-containing protein [Roseibacterium sp. SDUM158016]|uniref:3-hydroxyacyl-CoA dehydrogenase/enoyl-CoA hydratase family protein n=1 Tax=Roseicyclus sediminis TaxID=2980997 RepID=UPI0021CE81EA|nr:3-hydroxyacyl-CoA dehydrogenase/enoyl-CoA hydratase family protein [Roseibacterium sp. SDUM158016]MCU4652138.1 3-hydroxyacyl-CoA dehydrogenase NAD-binding domain-containing protein [Roseibacterium sp. SDUM158016]
MSDTWPNAARGTEETGIRRAAVIGAGSMGAGIAAQFANAGIPVDLLDLPGIGPQNRNAPAEAGVTRQLGIGGFTVPEAAALVRPGNVEDHLGRLSAADWIIEAVVENAALKKDLYARIALHRKPDAIVSSNTSTLLRGTLTSEMSDDVASHFLITHFFNPPRHMELLEVVADPDVPDEIVERVHRAGRAVLGKTTVACFDTPGFIANRIGCYWMAVAAIEAERHALRVEEADAVLAVFGVPRTGIFGLLDLVGLDLVPPVWGSLAHSLPAHDAIHRHDLSTHPIVLRQLEAGRLGRKSGDGFFRNDKTGTREALDLEIGEYRPLALVAAADLPAAGRDPKALIDAAGRYGDYAWSVFSHLVVYAAETVEEIAQSADALDTAVSLGYGWRQGPFALAERVGLSDIAARLAAEGRRVPVELQRAALRGTFLINGQLTAEGRRAPRIIQETPVARLEDAGDGIGIFRLTSKMGVIGPETFDVLEAALDKAGGDLRALVIAGETRRAFSAGVNLRHFLSLMDRADALDAFLERGQRAYERLRLAPVPVVAAVRGLALGGGCELMLHCDAVVAHVETRIGLPEATLGILPGWGGCTRMLDRCLSLGAADPTAAAARAFTILRAGTVAANAREAQSIGYLDRTAAIAMHLDDVERVAIEMANRMAEGYRAPEPAAISLAGGAAAAMLMAGVPPLSDTDADWHETVGRDMAAVLTGQPGGEAPWSAAPSQMHVLERAAVLRMVGRPQTRAAIDRIVA